MLQCTRNFSAKSKGEVVRRRGCTQRGGGGSVTSIFNACIILEIVILETASLYGYMYM